MLVYHKNMTVREPKQVMKTFKQETRQDIKLGNSESTTNQAVWEK